MARSELRLENRADRFCRTRRCFLFRDKRESRRKWKKALRVHEKIKQPHAPLAGEALSLVARELFVDSGADLQRDVRIEKHLDECSVTALPRIYDRRRDRIDIT